MGGYNFIKPVALGVLIGAMSAPLCAIEPPKNAEGLKALEAQANAGNAEAQDLLAMSITWEN